MESNEVISLVEEAIKARENSYCVYSHFAVGAALRTKDGRIFHGTNIENASFGLTSCAERNCLFNAISNGVNKDDIMELAIVADTEKPVSPCGACRQVIFELTNKDVKIYLSNLKKEVLHMSKYDLIPYCFDGSDLD